MHNPPHPGEFINAMYLVPHGISGRQLAAKLSVAPSTLNRILMGTSGVSPEMVLRLAKTLGRSPESWLDLQDRLGSRFQPAGSGDSVLPSQAT